MFNHSRFSSFENFAFSREGNALRRYVNTIARRAMGSSLAELDPNWHSVSFQFDDAHDPQRKLFERSLTDKDACRVEFDYRPSRVILVGPKVGNMLLTCEQVFGMVPEPLVALMRMGAVLRLCFRKLHNPRHVIELIDGRTVIEFENCTSGVVRNVRPSEGDAFDVEGIDQIELDERDQVHFTRASLMEGFKVEGLLGQPVDVDYFPLLAADGTPINSVEELIERRRREREAWEADAHRREAEAAARQAAKKQAEAEAYAALSPEEKAKVDARKARLAVQAGIARSLARFLPHP